MAADEDLPFVQKAQNGDTDAFDHLVEKYQGEIARLLFRFSANQGGVEDMVQETFVKAWNALPTWQPEKPFSHWLRRIAVRTGLEACRKLRRSPLSPQLREKDGSSLENIAASSNTGAWSAIEEVQYLLNMLPPEDRTLLTLIVLEETPLREMADLMGWTLVNTKVRAFRARMRLRKILIKQGYEIS